MKERINKDVGTENSTEESQPDAGLYLVLTAVLWSTSGLLIKMVNCNPIALAGIREFCRHFDVGICQKPKLNRSGWWGSGRHAATVILFVLANKMTTSANAILLQYTAPLRVLFARVFWGADEPIDWVTIMWSSLEWPLFKEAPGAF